MGSTVLSLSKQGILQGLLEKSFEFREGGGMLAGTFSGKLQVLRLFILLIHSTLDILQSALCVSDPFKCIFRFRGRHIGFFSRFP